MRKSTLFIAILALVFAACGDKKGTEEPTKNIGTSTKIVGDSTLYGLACDGCNDTILVFLPGTGSDPDTFNILSAMKQNRVIGKLQAGDWIAVIKNPTDKKRADMVINLDELKGTWVQMVTPTQRKTVNSIADAIDKDNQQEEDSLLRQLMKPIEQGFSLKRHYEAEWYGAHFNNDESSPVIYPQPKHYTEWHVVNGKLILTENIGGQKGKGNTVQNDTAEFIFMTSDSLRLRFKDGDQGYSRKQNK